MQTNAAWNIGERGCARRKLGGYVWLGLAIAAIAVMLMLHASRLTYLFLVVPIVLAAFGFFQAEAKTCVFHAARGTVERDHGVTRLDPSLRDAIRKQSNEVIAKSVVLAIMVTIAVYWLVGLLGGA